MKEVELFPAFMWDCDNCGRENFVRATIPQLSEEERAELKYEYDIDMDGFIMESPKRVICKFCETKFKTFHFCDNYEDEE